ncbi:MAG: hypothetical protein E6R03_14870 [Hyphomicrobiaceae bacterium]|nr:MAG: hypothetical protein E6R03_14870 [Hyphomicrobiaceae bacterium]
MPIQAAPFEFFKKYEGVSRTLRFDMNALAEFEQETGMGFGQLMQQKAIFAAVRGLLWAGFRHEDRRISIDRVGELMQMYVEDPQGPTHEISDLLAAAFTAATDQGAFGRVKESEFSKQLRLAAAKTVRHEANEANEPVILEHPPVRPDTPQDQ